MSLVNGYRVKCSSYKRMGEREKQDKAREERLGKLVQYFCMECKIIF